MSTKELTHERTVDELRIIERRLSYLKSANFWEPFRYNIFVDQMEATMSTLKFLQSEYSTENTQAEACIADQINNLLLQYQECWNKDYS
ncbi:MAG TPA: hypothetical protein VJU78_17180 [Chitinophagaceae bacterium]|nr:hypothetical protein [Chitinophagaceae bacterium]